MQLRENSKSNLIKVSTRLLLNAPIAKKVNDLFSNKYAKKDGNPTRNGKLIHLTLPDLINHFRSVERSILNYYGMADNFVKLAARVHYILKYSCALTIASKMKLNSLRKVFSKYGKNLTVISEQGDVISDYPTPSYKRRNQIYLTESCSPKRSY